MKSIEQLCLLQKRIQFEAVMRDWCPDDWTFTGDGYGGYENYVTELSWIAWQCATGTERMWTSTHFNEVCKMAEQHAGRGDDCGVLARTLLAAFTKLWVQRLS